MSSQPVPSNKPARTTLWRRKQKPERQQSALEAAQQLEWAVDNSPYWRDPENSELLRELYRLVDRIRKEAAPTPDGAIKGVMSAIKYNQCHTVEDICDETNLTT